MRSGSLRPSWYSGCWRITSRASASMPTSGSPARYLRQAAKKVSRTCSRLGSNILGLLPELAQVADHALRAAGLARDAGIAAVEYEPVVRVLEEFGGRELHQLQFYFEGILPRRQSGPVGDAEEVRVDGDHGLAERGVEHDIRRLAAHAGQALERLALFRHLAAVLFEQDPGQRNDVFRFHAIQTDGLDERLKPRHAELHHLVWRIRLSKEPLRRLVHRLVGGLRREHHGDEQLVRRAVIELGRRLGIRRLQAAKDLAPLLRVHRGNGLRATMSTSSAG